ncbi:MAG: hypothetical protein HY318_13100 [Armatimonadetes bacterium]|nr:hypothetical protein [Armatimonadota bacterium]
MSSILDVHRVKRELWQAWLDSKPGDPDAHEEGGFVLMDSTGILSVERWPRGLQASIGVPASPGGRRSGKLVIATFHTHPNTESPFKQEPTEDDVEAVRSDPDLRHRHFEGEFVISRERVFKIDTKGQVTVIGLTDQTLGSMRKE